MADDDDELEDIADGQQVQRDGVGRFRKVVLDPARASAMGQYSGELRKGHDDIVEKMLSEAGYGPDNPPPQYVRSMAHQAVKLPQAMRDWRRLTAVDAGPAADTFEVLGHYINVPKGERCPRCGTWNLVGLYNGDEMKQLADIVRSARRGADDDDEE